MNLDDELTDELSDEEADDNSEFLRCDHTDCIDYGNLAICYFDGVYKQCYLYRKV